jgi:hypothetical protein
MPFVSPNDRDSMWYVTVGLNICHNMSISTKKQARQAETFMPYPSFSETVDICWQDRCSEKRLEIAERPTDSHTFSPFCIRFYIRVISFLPEPLIDVIDLIWPNLPGKFDAAYEVSGVDELRFFKGNVSNCFSLYL